MGCKLAKMKAGEEPPPGVRPIEAVKRRISRHRERRFSSVSASELLRPDEVYPADDNAAFGGSWRSSLRELAESILEAGKKKPAVEGGGGGEAVKKERETKGDVAEETNNKEKVGVEENAAEVVGVEKEEKGRRLGSTCGEDEELPGSPSFRFYFTGSISESEDGSVKLGGVLSNINQDKETAQGTGDANESFNPSGGSELNQLKKKKGKKLRALAKAPTAVISQMRNARNAFSTATAQVESPHLVGGHGN